MFDQVASPIIGLINALLGPLLGIVGAAGAIFCVVLGVKFAKAEEQQEGCDERYNEEYDRTDEEDRRE
jgi:hypothetical protein